MWNWQKHLRTALLACVAAAGLSTTATWAGSLKDTPTTDTQRGVYFSGYDVVEGARYAFAGMVLALNNDISRDGWALRLYGSRVDFDLDPGDGRGWQGDVMLGYRFVRKHMYGGIYVGGDYQNYRLSPDDPTAKVRGTEVGVKVAAELATSKELPYYFALNGNYSTAFDVYWARARVGLIRGGVTFGPEGIVFADQEFNAQRWGGSSPSMSNCFRIGRSKSRFPQGTSSSATPAPMQATATALALSAAVKELTVPSSSASCSRGQLVPGAGDSLPLDWAPHRDLSDNFF